MKFEAPFRAGKPRSQGITSVIDFGPDSQGWGGPRGIADLLDCAADYIDYAKIYALNALLMPQDIVKQIVKLYRDADVKPYAGGILFEYAYRRGEMEGYFSHLRRIGLPMAEISENYISLRTGEYETFVEQFQENGIAVIYEFGRKNPEEAFSLSKLESIVSTNLELGVEHIIVEQSELDLVRKEAPRRLVELAKKSWIGKILIETDPYSFPSQHVELIHQFGPDVNLANVTMGQALRLEGLRRGVGRAVDYSLFKKGCP